jgi:hypothetical protein
MPFLGGVITLLVCSPLPFPVCGLSADAVGACGFIVGSILTYVFYWVAAAVMLVYMKFKEVLLPPLPLLPLLLADLKLISVPLPPSYLGLHKILRSRVNGG